MTLKTSNSLPLYIEESLDAPLKSVLAVIQNHILLSSTYFGVPTVKPPTDFWTYQEIIFQIKPDVIIEIGNYYGGSTLALAHLCDLLGKGRILGIDIDHSRLHALPKAHPRIKFVESDAVQALSIAEEFSADAAEVLIIEDSSHTYDNTLAVLKAYGKLVTVGSYFIVEDSICRHGIDDGPAPGPYEAIESFVAMDKRFAIDRSREPFVITWNPKGYLRKVADH